MNTDIDTSMLLYTADAYEDLLLDWADETETDGEDGLAAVYASEISR